MFAQSVPNLVARASPWKFINQRRSVYISVILRLTNRLPALLVSLVNRQRCSA